MCDFKPGDEVICVDDEVGPLGLNGWPPLVMGAVYIVSAIEIDGSHFCRLADFPYHQRWLCQERFRKAQRRDLSTWLETSVGNTDKLDKRQKKGVRA